MFRLPKTEEQEKKTGKNAFQRLPEMQQSGHLRFFPSGKYQGTTKTHSKQWHCTQCVMFVCIPLFIYLLCYFP